MSPFRQSLQAMEYPELCTYWVQQFVEKLTLTQLDQVVKNNQAMISQFPSLRNARRTYEEVARRTKERKLRCVHQLLV